MFQAIEALARSAGKLVLSLKMDGDKMVVFLTPQGGKDAVLRQPLILTATPAELDEGFIAAVQSYSSAHKSLDEQVAATTAILEAAQKTQVGKAQKVLAKGSKPAPSPDSTGSNDDDEDEESEQTAESEQVSVAADAAPAAAAQPSGTDLTTLLL
jgi:PRTRC genetic system protein E